ncbi:MAG: TfoX/Sxy family protein [Methanomassiliicoccales archaeon]|jgi:TfoX/Sxy family transcriptional regulator of competence genes
MEWKKAPEKLIKFLEERMMKVDCEHRTMFGYPAYFINGNMFAGAFQDILFLRLPDSDRTKVEKSNPSIRPFEPMKGRPMGEYVAIPKPLYEDESFFDEWLERSVECTRSLPVKTKAKR